MKIATTLAAGALVAFAPSIGHAAGGCLVTKLGCSCGIYDDWPGYWEEKPPMPLFHADSKAAVYDVVEASAPLYGAPMLPYDQNYDFDDSDYESDGRGGRR
jgi:hypothetical protein